MSDLREVTFRDVADGLIEARCPVLSLERVTRIRAGITCHGIARLSAALVFLFPADQREAFQAAYERTAAIERPLTVPLYLGFSSPFAFLATRQSEMLEAEFEVNFDFRFWEVRPDWMPFPDWLDDPELRKQIRARSNAMLHKYDIPLPADRGGYRPRTRQMNEAAEYARSLGFLKPYAKALYWAYFIDQRQVGELDVLGQIAEEVGMVRRSLEEAVLNGRFADAVDQHELNACGLGVFGVPTYVINGQTIWGRDMLDVVRDALAAAGVQAR